MTTQFELRAAHSRAVCHNLTNAELAKEVHAQFPNLRGTLAVLLMRFERLTDLEGSIDAVELRAEMVEKAEDVLKCGHSAQCPNCGTVLTAVLEQLG